MEGWWRHAKCSAHGPDLWFSDRRHHQAEAVAICRTCPAAGHCLDAAVRRNETHGIWGGVPAPFSRSAIRRAFLSGDPLAYAAARADALAHERPQVEPVGCHRCGSVILAGRHPLDNNPPGATCGHVSTWNKGCRCEACRDAKSVHDRRSRGGSSAVPPDGQLVLLDSLRAAG